METKISLKDIYQQNLNFLIGAGASSGLFSTLRLPIKNSDQPSENETIETLATKLEAAGKSSHLALLFMYYFKEVIEPVLNFKLTDIDLSHSNEGHESSNCSECKQKLTVENYDVFLESLVLVLTHKNNFTRRCNLFTTNYDGCIPFTADKLLQSGKYDFSINDGTRGFLSRTISSRNFNSYICQTGIFGNNTTDIPQINLINLHGSAYWKKAGESIQVNYSPNIGDDIIPAVAAEDLATFTAILNEEDNNTNDVLDFDVEIDKSTIDDFWSIYNRLPIVNPTKWKFYETVFEEHYYQMLRLLSYELEKPNSVLITFAFSFADEHIENLVKRSLSNPRLQVYICCFSENSRQSMEEKFGSFRNVSLVHFEDKNLDFTAFNEQVFNADFLRDEDEH